MSRNILAVDIGGSKLMVGVVDLNGRVWKKLKRELPARYDENFLVSTVCEMAEELGEGAYELCGISVPGIADAHSGQWLYAPFSGISDFPIASIVSDKLGVMAFADNDVNLCALAEKYFGSCRHTENFLWVTVSNGIGGGLVLDGELYRGRDGIAGEFGHLSVTDREDAVCDCGLCGCVEAVASGRAIKAAYLKETGRQMSAKDIAVLARSGDKPAAKVYFEAGYYLGRAISSAASLLNIERAVLGGGVSMDLYLLLPGIDEGLRRHCFAKSAAGLKIEGTALGYDAALIGCAALVKEKIENGQCKIFV